MKIVAVKQHSSWYQKSRTMPYLTIYVRPSPSLAKSICQARDTLKVTDSRQLYSPYSYLHVTVKELGYLGEAVRQEQLPAILSIIRDVISNHEPFDLEVDGMESSHRLSMAGSAEGRPKSAKSTRSSWRNWKAG